MSLQSRPRQVTTGPIMKRRRVLIPATALPGRAAACIPRSSNGVGAGEGNPKRVSLWEVHPIYKFEVCTGNCDGAGTWVPLDEWVKQQK